MVFSYGTDSRCGRVQHRLGTGIEADSSAVLRPFAVAGFITATVVVPKALLAATPMAFTADRRKCFFIKNILPLVERRIDIEIVEMIGSRQPFLVPAKVADQRSAFVECTFRTCVESSTRWIVQFKFAGRQRRQGSTRIALPSTASENRKGTSGKIGSNPLDQIPGGIDIRTHVPEIMIRYGQDDWLAFSRLLERLPHILLLEAAGSAFQHSGIARSIGGSCPEPDSRRQTDDMAARWPAHGASLRNDRLTARTGLHPPRSSTIAWFEKSNGICCSRNQWLSGRMT